MEPGDVWKRRKVLRRVVTCMGVIAILAGLLGCSKEPKPAQHTIEDISSISISCCHMDRSFGYYFCIRREDNKWLFDAECFIHDHNDETVLENCVVATEEMDTLFEILERSNSIAYAENYKKPIESPFEVLDETTYSFCLTFSDGSQYVTCDWQKELEDYFYQIAEQMSETSDTGDRS